MALYYGKDGPGDACKDLASRCNRNSIPLGLLALDGNVLSGTVAIDLDPVTSQTPSVVGLLVRADRRNSGVATALLRAAEAHAKQLGFRHLFLNTSVLSDFLIRSGWRQGRTVYPSDEPALTRDRFFVDSVHQGLSGHYEVVMDRRKRRRWSADEKRSICAQAQAPGVSVAQVARRYSMNANLIFKWLRDPRFAPKSEGAPSFLPVEVTGAAIGLPEVAPAGFSSGGGFCIELAGGHRVVAEGGFDPEALGRLLKAWLS
ncbi:MAG: IS66-like element accessory protein TnpA [Rhodospirillales bacterium]